MANSVETTSPAPSVLSWDIEEASLSIRIHAAAFNRLTDECLNVRLSQAGVLLGHEVPGAIRSVIVEDFQPFSTGGVDPAPAGPVIDHGSIEELIRRWKAEAGRLIEVVGCYAVVAPAAGDVPDELQQQLIA